jgi:hypothetical protein
MLTAAWISAVAAGLLAILAAVTAWYARGAFREQSREVRAIEQQVTDQLELTRQQAELLKVQSGQLELQRQQLDDQRKANTRQAEVLELQAAELRESLDERKRETEQRRSAQASRVFIWEEGSDQHVSQAQRAAGAVAGPLVTAHVKNSSDQPIYEAELRWHRGSAGYGEPNPEPLGTIMPGVEVSRMRDFPPGTNMAVSGAVLRFSDAAGVRWLRRPDGYLNEFTG